MTADQLSILVVALLCGSFALDALADALNLKAMRTELPAEFQGLYDAGKYERSLQYQKINARAGTLRRAIGLVVTLGFIFQGGFNAVDAWARGIAGSWGLGSIASGLIFIGGLSVLRALLQMPFSIYETFIIEERFGFNRTTPRTFVIDLFKGMLLTAAIGGPVLAGLLWFFENAGPLAWLYSWTAFTALQLLIVFLAPVVLMPLFNQFKPLDPGPLKDEIARYAQTEGFALQGVYTMDGSKRSTKANAYFTGFGAFRRLVLFDTLIAQQTVDELTAVVAHEVGHFREGHILRSMALSIVVTGVMLYTLGFFLSYEPMFAAFRMEQSSIYAGLVIATMFYGPILRPLSVLTQGLSRYYEFEADEYSARTYGKPEQLISALKKLSIENLSNLTPHPLKILLDYTHPPVLQRIEALRTRSARKA